MNRPLVCLILLLLPAARLSGQALPYRGVVWQRPDGLAEAAADLHRMREAGIEAVRTGLIADDRLLTLADTLGLHIFQELPVDFFAADRLADTLAFARPLVERILRQAAAHPSVRHVGLARRSDTSDPQACSYFEALADMVDAADTIAVQVYYTTLFIEDDACSAAVDLVLYEGSHRLDPETPGALVQRWQAGHAAPLGLAGAGRWVAADGPSGYHAPHSPEGQARFLETVLGDALGTPDLYAVFVNRWRDTMAETPTFVHDPLRPYARPYGLLAADDTPRPALRVVKGLYTGDQQVFALPAGDRPPAADWSVPTLMIWILALLLGVIYAQNVHFRDGLRRYFIAHGFYIETVSRGRDVDLFVNGFLLAVFALAAGIVGAVLAHLLHAWPPLGLLTAWLGRLDVLFLPVLERPWVGLLLFGALFALIQILWAVGLSPLAGLRRRMSSPQHLMLVIWPRWPVLFIAAAALAVANLPLERQTPRAGLLLAGLWIVAAFWARMRTLTDYAQARRAPRIQILATGLGLFVLVLGGFVLALLFGGLWPEVEFLAHLATRK